MKKFKTYSILLALVIFIPFLIPTNLKAQTYTLNLVADLLTPIPGGFGAFDDLGNPVSLDTVESEAFIGSANPAEGIYTNVGGSPVLVADKLTAIPGGSGNFTDFRNLVSLGGGDVAFLGFGSTGQEGIYTFIAGTLALVADLSTAIPGGSGNFTSFQRLVSQGGGDVAFFGSGSTGQSGIYTDISGTLALVADTNTSIPGGTGNFDGFSDPVSLGGGDVAFFGFGSTG